MRIGIFGCTADPFTEAHTAIVEKILTENIVDRVIIAPTIVDWHREGKTSWLNSNQKCELINLRLNNANFRILDNVLNNDPDNTVPKMTFGQWDIWVRDLRLKEFCKSNPILTEKYVKNHRFIDTLVEIIQHKEGNNNSGSRKHEYYVILGTDSYLNFKTWTMWQEIPKLAKLIVVNGRDGIKELPVDPELPCIQISIDEKFANTSASKIREEWMNKGFNAYMEFVKDSFNKERMGRIEKLLHTPIFDVVKAPELIDNPGFRPIKVDAPDWVTIIVEHDGKFLVEKQFRYGSNCDIEEFPCGMVNKDELPFIAAVRELEEETGYKVDHKDLICLGVVNPNPAFMTNKMHYYYVNLDKVKFDIVNQNLDEHEKLTFYWTYKDKFVASSLYKVTHNIQTPAMLLTAFKMLDNLQAIMDILGDRYGKQNEKQ